MKTFINTALLKEQLKRYWPIAAMAMLWYLLTIVLRFYETGSTVNYHRISADMIRLLSLELDPMIWTMVAVPFCTAMVLFSYPFKAASTTAFHSFPINRRQLFFTNWLTGLLLMLVPLMILSLGLLAPVRFVEYSVSDWIVQSFIPGLADGDVINTPIRVGGFFLRSALAFSLYFAIFMLAMSLAGSRVTAILLAGAIAIVPTALVGLSRVIGELYIFGLAMPSPIGIVTMHVHPLFWSRAFGWHTFGFRAGTLSNWHTLYISYGLITLAGFGLSYLAYRLRPQERAGDAVVFIPLKRVLIFLVAMAGMFFMGVIGLFAIGGRVGLYLGFVLGFAIAYFIAQMLAEKTFRVGHKAKHLASYGVVAVGIYLLLVLVTNVGLLGYVRRVPETREIQGVHVRQGWGGWAWPQDVFIYDSTTIAWVQDIHRRIIAERGYLQRERWRNIDSWGMTPLTIMYRLSDGSIMSRSYTLTPDFFDREGIINLMQSDPVVLSGFPALRAPENIRFIEITVRNDDYWVAMRALDFARISAGAYSVDYDDLPQITESFIAVIDDAQQIAQLAHAVRRDISYEARGGMIDWRSDLLVFVDTGDSTDVQRSGFFRRVRMGGYTADWLKANNVLVEMLE